MRIQALTEEYTEQFRGLRLQALRDTPEAFGSSYEEESQLSATQFIQKFAALRTAIIDNFILGAFDESNRLVGVVGLYPEPKKKTQHKANVVGMYVAPEARNQSVGRLLLEELIARASRLERIRKLNLAVVSTNIAAKRLYLSLGFQVYGVERDALKVGDTFYDEDLMALMLNK